MFRISLREHHQLCVSGVALQLREAFDEIVYLVIGQCKAKASVGLCQSRATATEYIDMLQRCRGLLPEQLGGCIDTVKYRFRHTIVQQRLQ